MIRLPVISTKELIKALGKLGYNIDRQKGSHLTLAHPLGKTVTIPSCREIKKGMLKRILREVGISNEDLLKLLRKR